MAKKKTTKKSNKSKSTKKHTNRKKQKDEKSECHIMNTKRVAYTCGIFWALSIGLFGIASGVFGMGAPLVHLLGSFYLGYDNTFLGIILGMIWAAVDGVIGGYIFAWLYNKLGCCLHKCGCNCNH